MELDRLGRIVAAGALTATGFLAIMLATPATAQPVGSCPASYTPVSLQNGTCFCSPDLSTLPEIGACGSSGRSSSNSLSSDLIGQALVRNSQYSAEQIKSYLDH